MKGGLITFGIVGVFVIFLVFSFYYQSVVDGNKEKQWPPFISKCPEYWELNNDGTQCVNNTNINGITGSSDVPVYNGSNAQELKDLESFNSWDGITNNKKI
tara:strand:- start:871 stop:1173 length:303 start_codon:yes stop_codon:yes gene_type:complete